MVIIYIPHIVIIKATPSEIVDYIMGLLWHKTTSEGYISFYLIAFNEAVNLIRAYQAIMAVEIAKKALEEAREANNGVKRLEERFNRFEQNIESEFKEIKKLIKKAISKD